jgi:hypothetical protein
MDLKHRTKQLVATVALAGAATAGTAGIAVAAEGDAGSGASAPAAAAQHHPRRAIRHAVARVVTETHGVERAELRAALRGGQSIAEYATSLGQEPQTVVDALVAAVNGRVDQAVANGRITAERGDEITANAPGRVDTLVNRHFGQGQGS